METAFLFWAFLQSAVSQASSESEVLSNSWVVKVNDEGTARLLCSKYNLSFHGEVLPGSGIFEFVQDDNAVVRDFDGEVKWSRRQSLKYRELKGFTFNDP